MPSLRAIFRRLRGRRAPPPSQTSSVSSSGPQPANFAIDTFIHPAEPQEVKDLKALVVMVLAWSRLQQAGREGVADLVEALGKDSFGEDMWLRARQMCIQYAV